MFLEQFAFLLVLFASINILANYVRMNSGKFTVTIAWAAIHSFRLVQKSKNHSKALLRKSASNLKRCFLASYHIQPQTFNLPSLINH